MKYNTKIFNIKFTVWNIIEYSPKMLNIIFGHVVDLRFSRHKVAFL